MTGQRAQTAVLALACTAGPDVEGGEDDTVLFRDPIVIDCDGVETVLDPTLGAGNVYGPVIADPDPSDAIWQYATYFGDEALRCDGAPCNKRYWNVAIGFDPTAADCTLTTRATAASAATIPEYTTPEASTYPVIEIDVDLTGPDGGRVCSRHGLDGATQGLTTEYTPVETPVSFCHRLAGASPETEPRDGCPEPPPHLVFGWYGLSPHYAMDPQYTQGLSDAERIERWRLPLVEGAAQGWDFVMRYGASNPTYAYDVGGDTYDLIRFLDEAETLGVKVMVDLERTGGVPTPAVIDEVVGAVKEHPAVYGYYLIDEPELRPEPPYNVTVSGCIEAYQQVKSLDPTRPVIITMSAPIGEHTGFLAAADIIGKELYAPSHWDAIEDDIAVVRGAGKPFLIVPRIYVDTGGYAAVMPTAEEFELNLLMPIAMGALQGPGGGVFPFLFEGFPGGRAPPPASTDFRATIVYLKTEIVRSLALDLAAGTPSRVAFEWLVGPSEPDDFRYVLLGRSTSDLVLIVAHRGDDPVDVSFRVDGLPPTSDVAVRVDDEGVLALGPGGVFPTASFAPHEARAYRIKAFSCPDEDPCLLPIHPSGITPSFSSLDPSDPDSEIGHLVDGDPTTAFGFGAGPPASLLIDLGAVRHLDRIELTVLQSPYGVTLHEVATGLTADALTPAATLNQYTETHDVLVAPLAGVEARFIRVETVASPSWVAWLELAIYGD